jgi:hypothetical protein
MNLPGVIIGYTQRGTTAMRFGERGDGSKSSLSAQQAWDVVQSQPSRTVATSV